MSGALLKEIASVKDFFKGRDYEEGTLQTLSNNFATSLVQQINSCLTISLPDASSLIEALNDSPYDDSNLKKIIDAVDSKVLNSTAERMAASCPKDQVLKERWNMCTQEDWDFFRSHHGFHAKMTKLVDRGQSVGCIYPDEQSLKWMLAMLLLTHYTDKLLGPKAIYDKLQELKLIVACERKPYPHEQLATFPSKPQDLPKAVFDHAYKDGPPISVVVPGIKSFAETAIPLRSNSKLLKQKGSSPKKHQPASPSSLSLSSPQPVQIDAGGPASDDSKGMPSDDLPTPGGKTEEQLYIRYKTDLWTHKAQKRGIRMAPCTLVKDEPQQSPAPTVPMKIETDGSLTLQPRRLGEQLEPAEAPSGKPDGGSLTLQPRLCGKTSPSAAASSDKSHAGAHWQALEADGDSSDLDEHSMAAIAALDARNLKKKQALAE